MTNYTARTSCRWHIRLLLCNANRKDPKLRVRVLAYVINCKLIDAVKVTAQVKCGYLRWDKQFTMLEIFTNISC